MERGNRRQKKKGINFILTQPSFGRQVVAYIIVKLQDPFSNNKNKGAVHCRYIWAVDRELTKSTALTNVHL